MKQVYCLFRVKRSGFFTDEILVGIFTNWDLADDGACKYSFCHSDVIPPWSSPEDYISDYLVIREKPLDKLMEEE